jgi:hypothetical protein
MMLFVGFLEHGVLSGAVNGLLSRAYEEARF